MSGPPPRVRPGLAIQVSDRLEDSLDHLGGTFRDEGMSIAYNRLSVQGEEVAMLISQDDLIQERKIGQGACSTVIRCRHQHTGEPYAVKMFSVYDKARRSQLQKEILLLSQLECDSLITFYGAFHNEGNIGVILEYMDRGSLEFLLDPNVDVTDHAMACIAYQIVWGLAYLHYDNMLHRDIKPGNVLLNSQGAVKLSDFGISRMLDDSQALSSTSVGTFHYMSAERLYGEEYNASSDVWSVAIMLIELWEKRFPYEDSCSSPIELVQRLEDSKANEYRDVIPRSASKRFRQFLISAMTIPATSNKNTGTLLQTEWFTEQCLDCVEVAQEGVVSWLHIVDGMSAPSDKKPRRDGSGHKGSSKDSDGECEYDHDFEEYDPDFDNDFKRGHIRGK